MNDSRKDLGTPEPGPSFDILELVLFGIGRFRYWIVLTTVIGLAVGVFMSLIEPNIYSSNGKFLVRFGEREKRAPEQAIRTGGGQLPGMVAELHLLLSQELYESVAKKVGPDKILKPFDPTEFDNESTPKLTRWQHQFQDWWFNRNRKPSELESEPTEPVDVATLDPKEAEELAEREQLKLERAATQLRGRIQIVSDRFAPVLVVKGMAYSAELAQEIVAATMEAARERHAAVYADQVDTEFIEKQLTQYQELSQEAEDEYMRHRDDCGFYDIESERGIILAGIQNLKGDLEGLDFRVEQIDRELEQIESLLETTPQTVLEVKPAVEQPNPDYTILRSDLKRLQGELRAKEVRFRDGAEALEDWREKLGEEIARVEAELEQTPPLILGTEKEMDRLNPVYQKLLEQQRALQNEQELIPWKRETKTEQLEEKNRQLFRLLACEPVHRELRGSIATAAARRQQFQLARSKTETFQMLDQDPDMSNLVTVQTAAFDPRKVRPKRGKTVLTGLMGGLAAGLAFGFLRQLLDSKLRFPKSIERQLGVKVLGVLPEQPKWRRLGRRVRRRAAG